LCVRENPNGQRVTPIAYDRSGALITMTETKNRRQDHRIRLEAFYSSGRVDGTGALADVSYSGALVEDASMKPAIGTRVLLYLYLEPPSAFEAAAPFELAGHVVRHSATGFAIEYNDNLDPDVRRMVDDAAAVVAVPR
jgi:hypothetical protein